MKLRRRFSIRTLLAVVGLIAIAVAHLAYQARIERETLRRISNANGQVYYRRHDLERDEVAIAGVQGELYDEVPPGAEFMHLLLGKTFMCDATQIYLPGNVDEQTLREVCRMPRLRRLNLLDAMVDPVVVNGLRTEFPSINFVTRKTPKPTNSAVILNDGFGEN